MTDTSQLCPTPRLHGNPFRYCPNCTWTELPPHPDLAANQLEPGAAKPEPALIHRSYFVSRERLAKVLKLEGSIFKIEPCGLDFNVWTEEAKK